MPFIQENANSHAEFFFYFIWFEHTAVLTIREMISLTNEFTSGYIRNSKTVKIVGSRSRRKKAVWVQVWVFKVTNLC